MEGALAGFGGDGTGPSASWLALAGSGRGQNAQKASEYDYGFQEVENMLASASFGRRKNPLGCCLLIWRKHNRRSANIQDLGTKGAALGRKRYVQPEICFIGFIDNSPIEGRGDVSDESIITALRADPDPSDRHFQRAHQ